MTDDTRLDEIKARLAAITDGPSWDAQIVIPLFVATPPMSGARNVPASSNAIVLCANAPDDLAWCVAEIEQLRRERDAAQQVTWVESGGKLVITSRDALREENERLKADFANACDVGRRLEAELHAVRETWMDYAHSTGRRAQTTAEVAAAIDDARRTAEAEVERLAAQSDSWRLAYNSWQDWATELLDDLGRQPIGGEHGDGPAREIIAQLAGMAPGVPRCSRCGCFVTRHEVDDEERRECADCECTQCEQAEQERDEARYPCAKCGKARTKDQGGTTFTVCDECWDATKAKGRRR